MHLPNLLNAKHPRADGVRAPAAAARPAGLRLRALLAALGATGFTAAVLVALALVGGRLGLWAGSPAVDLGVRERQLAPPSTRPNSVSSQALHWPDHPRRAAAHIEPLPLVSATAAPGAGAGDAAPGGDSAAEGAAEGGAGGAADGAATLRRIAVLLESVPGAAVIEQRSDYLRVAFTTRWMRYVDDAEFWFDPVERVVHVRSASRLGYSDGGLNRSRIESIRRALASG
jgi:uncharacterized protein (DUF1499 family)